IWLSTVRTDSDTASAISRFDSPCATSTAISRSRLENGGAKEAAAIAGPVAPPHTAANRCARAAAVSALPARPTTAWFGDQQLMGMMDGAAFLPDGVPSHWAVYLGAQDVDKTLQA